LKRAGVENIEPLIALQRAELEAVGGNEARERLAGLEALRANVAAIRSDRELALHRLDLAIGGRDVMRILGWGPGPHIGAALRHLTDRVVEDPSHNEPERLRELLLAWSETADAAVARRAPRWSHRATTAEEEEER
jgi:tRNA nucleotidyltransferase (CCA-adding enzyme)